MDTFVYPYVGLYIVLVLVALLIPALCVARTFVIRRRFVCPSKGKDVKATFVCRRSGRRLIPLRVKSCTAFGDPKKIECDQKCVRLLVRAASRFRRARA